MEKLRSILVIVALPVALGGAASQSRAKGVETAVKGPTFYVATDGNDRWSGTLPSPNNGKTDGPFATLARGRDAAREVKARPGAAGPITISVRGGKYYLKETLTLDSKDSGSQERPIVYTAYPGEKPVLSGGRKLTNCKLYRAKILECEAPGTRGGAWKFRQLFFNGESLTRARYPSLDPQNPLYGGYLKAEGPAAEGSYTLLRYPQGAFPHHWAKPTQGEVFIWDAHNWGYTKTIPIKSLDESSRTIELARPIRDVYITPWFWPSPIAAGEQFYVENLLEELDQPGEWCLDTEQGTVYVWPPPGKAGEIVAPYLDRLIDLQASFTTISGFVFTETHRGGDAAHPTGVDGLGAMFDEVGDSYCGEAIRMEDAANCIIEDNEFRDLGGNGVYLQQYNTRNAIRYNHFTRCGSNAVVLAGGRVVGPRKDPEHPLFNQVTDNEIQRCGVFDKSSAGVFLGRSEGNNIAHNLIHDMPHHAVNLGSNPYARNYVEYNRIHHVCLETHDTGAINAWMDVPREWERSGHFIRYNFISDVLNPTNRDLAFFSGIYLDDETSNCLVYGNIIVRTRIGLFVKGKNNVVENNIIAESLPLEATSDTAGYAAELLIAGHSHHFQWFSASDRVQKNILYKPITAVNVSWTNNEPIPAALRYLQECDYNVYFNDGGDIRFRIEGLKEQTISLADWQKATDFDRHSLVADPLFVDPAHDDYRLRPESPAIKLGFVPIDVEHIGIRPR